MKLSTRSRYATRMLLDLAEHRDQGAIRMGEIAKRQEISLRYLDQLIRPLKKAKIVNSVRGRKGGHMLALNPREISLGKIIRIFETPTELVECVSSPDKCAKVHDCRVRNAWVSATNALYEKLDSITIADLLSKNFSSNCDSP